MTTQKSRVKAPTVADVARAARVSKAQAARALGGYGAVSEEVQLRVNEAAARLGYRPNELARSMNTGRSNTIGAIVGDIENPHFGLALRGMADVARQAGYHLLLSNSDENLQAEQEATRVMLEKRVDGIIVAPCSSAAKDNHHLAQILDDGRALVLFDRHVPELDVEAVCVDFGPAAREVTQLMLDAGHQRIAYITSMRCNPPWRYPQDLGPTPVAQRVQGMESAFAQAGVPFDASLIKVNALDEPAIARIVSELWQRPLPPTALIASDSLIAMSLLRELSQRGLRIPEDISFAMYDNFPWTEIVSPPLTVVTQPVYEMGREAARRLIARIRQQAVEPLHPFQAQLLVRRSIAPPPGD